MKGSSESQERVKKVIRGFRESQERIQGKLGEVQKESGEGPEQVSTGSRESRGSRES